MTCCGNTSASDVALTNSRKALARIEEERFRQTSVALDNGLMQTVFTVPEMHCAGCIGTIERGLDALDFVESVRANLSKKQVSVIWHGEHNKGLTIATKLKDLGFEATVQGGLDEGNDPMARTGIRLLLSLGVAGFAAANIMLLSVSVWSGADAETTQLFHLISGLIALPAVAYAGQPFFGSAFKALRAGRLNMDVPISLAVLMALGMGVYESLTGGAEAYFDAAMMLLFFLLIGRYLDQLMREKARGAAQRLTQLAAKGGVLVEPDGATRYIALNDIEEGMLLRVKPGERLPVNAVIAKGTTDVDRSLVTGESDSIACSVGDKIEAGILNLTGAVDVKTTSTAQTSFVAEMSKMIDAAENGRGKYRGLAERMAQIYAPAVHLLAFITFVGWFTWTGGDWHASLYTAIAVLIITCPCALGLAVPVVHVVGAQRLMGEGILMRDGSGLERLEEVDTAVFDKTGTLTSGSPQVIDVVDYDEKHGGLIKALALHSTHPHSAAMVEFFDDMNAVELDDVREMPGFGVEAMFNGNTVRLGRPSWVLEIGNGDAAPQANINLCFGMRGANVMKFQMQDELRPSAHNAINGLKAVGLGVQIVSGDKRSEVERIAESLNVGDFVAEATPGDKIDVLAALRNKGHKVLMVGDGLNDAPALAAGHVSMAPATASDVGRMVSDFVFTKPSLNSVLIARRIAKETGALVRQNFAIAIAYNCCAVPLAMAGYITPLLAAIAMSTSSILVVGNSMRLNLMTFDEQPKSVLPDPIDRDGGQSFPQKPFRDMVPST